MPRGAGDALKALGEGLGTIVNYRMQNEQREIDYMRQASLERLRHGLAMDRFELSEESAMARYEGGLEHSAEQAREGRELTTEQGRLGREHATDLATDRNRRDDINYAMTSHQRLLAQLDRRGQTIRDGLNKEEYYEGSVGMASATNELEMLEAQRLRLETDHAFRLRDLGAEGYRGMDDRGILGLAGHPPTSIETFMRNRDEVEGGGVTPPPVASDQGRGGREQSITAPGGAGALDPSNLLTPDSRSRLIDSNQQPPPPQSGVGGVESGLALQEPLPPGEGVRLPGQAPDTVSRGTSYNSRGRRRPRGAIGDFMVNATEPMVRAFTESGEASRDLRDTAERFNQAVEAGRAPAPADLEALQGIDQGTLRMMGLSDTAILTLQSPQRPR